MKKFLLTIALAFTACMWTMAETVDEFIATMKSDTTVECVELTPDMLKAIVQQQMAQAAVPNDTAMKILQGTRTIQILDGKLPEASEAINAFKERLAALTVDGLDEMVSTNEKGEFTRVWMQVEGDKCTMILVVTADEDDHDWQVVKVGCDIKMDENFNLNDLIHLN